MYYEEKLIDGVMCWRSTPRGEFMPYTLEELSRRYESAVQEINRLLTATAGTEDA